MDKLLKLWHSTGLYHIEVGQLFMIAVCILLIYLAIKKGFEPLLLLPIGFGGLLANIPVGQYGRRQRLSAHDLRGGFAHQYLPRC